MAVEETIEALDAADRVEVVGSLRRGEGGLERFAMSLAEAHVAGAVVDWPVFFAGSGARRAELPTYAFQRERYWVAPGTGAGDLAAAGLGRLDHPLLAAVVRVGDRDEWLFTGCLSAGAQPWLRDHAVFGMVVVPGAALVEVALAAGRDTASPVVEELVLEAPLVLPDDAVVQVQVTVAQADEDGRREVAVFSCPQTRGEDEQREVTCHARGTLAREMPLPGEPFPAAWPPPGAGQVAVGGLYGRLAEAGYDYGPLFQGVRAAWRAGEEVYTEVVLPEEAGAVPGFGIHPALLDAALHGGLLEKEAGSRAELPFSWSGVRLGHGAARGCGSGSARRAGRRCGSTSRMSTESWSRACRSLPSGRSIRPSLRARGGRGAGRCSRSAGPRSRPGAARARRGSRSWVRAAGGERRGRGPVRGSGRAGAGGRRGGGGPGCRRRRAGSPAAGHAGAAEAARAVAEGTLGLLQRWLASADLAGARLVVATRGGIAVGDEAPDLAVAPVWGLVRSAQSEHPGRFVLIDLDGGGEPDWGSLTGA